LNYIDFGLNVSYPAYPWLTPPEDGFSCVSARILLFTYEALITTLGFWET